MLNTVLLSTWIFCFIVTLYGQRKYVNSSGKLSVMDIVASLVISAVPFLNIVILFAIYKPQGLKNFLTKERF